MLPLYRHQSLDLVAVMGSQMIMGPDPSQQEVSIRQSFYCKMKHLSQPIALVGLPFHIFILFSHTKVLQVWVRE